MMIAFALTNAYCSLKSQQVAGVAKRYKELLDQLIAFYALQGSPTVGPRLFQFEADLQTVNLPGTQIDSLEQMLFEKVSPPGRALLVCTSLRQATRGLSQAVEVRNSIIADLRARSPLPSGLLEFVYIGLPNQQGHVDSNFRDCVVAISTQTDDCIFFSKTLMEDLVCHGKGLASKLGKNAPRVPEPDFARASADGLIPPDSQYEEWLAGYRERAVPTKNLEWANLLQFADWG
ncbi:MAG: hypothetical protein ABL967_20640 [Bryobacteraceae bacterium]